MLPSKSEYLKLQGFSNNKFAFKKQRKEERERKNIKEKKKILSQARDFKIPVTIQEIFSVKKVKRKFNFIFFPHSSC